MRHAAPRTPPLRSGPMRQCTGSRALCRARAAGQPQSSTNPRGEAPRPCMQSMVRAHERRVCCAMQQLLSCFILYPVGFQPLRWAFNHRQDALGVKSESAGAPAQGTRQVGGSPPIPCLGCLLWDAALTYRSGYAKPARHDDTRRQKPPLTRLVWGKMPHSGGPSGRPGRCRQGCFGGGGRG